MKKMYKLEKNVKLYKNQFDKFILDINGDYRLDRTSLDLDGLLFKMKYILKNKKSKKDLDKIPELRKLFIDKSIELRKIFGNFVYELLIRIAGVSEVFDINYIEDILVEDVKIDTVNVSFKMIVMSEYKDLLNYIDNVIPEDTVYNIFPNEFFRIYNDSYNDGIAKAYPELFENRQQDKIGVGKDSDVFCHNLTFQTSERCSLNCTYCFSGDSKVTMADGSKKYIKDIKVGDMVLACPEDITNIDDNEEFYNGKHFVPTKVTHVFQRESKTIKVNWNWYDGQFRVTRDHPFLTPSREWLSIEEIMRSDNPSHGFVLCNKDKYVTSVNVCELEYIDSPIVETVYNLETELHTFIVSDLVCHNCYQFNKSPMRMDFDTAKDFIDHLLNDDYGYINRYNSPAIIIEFIGGEPFLEINLTRKIYEYFLDRCYELDHPWFTLHRLSICSNGLQYFDEDVQDFFKDYSHNISFNISIDGNRKLHDSCRIQHNGEGSYDIDMAALQHYSANYASERNSKMTLAPSNIKYLFESVVDFINKGMYSININCVFEEGWTPDTAKTEYYQLKKLADYLIDNNLDNLYIAIFRERQEDVQRKSYDGNFCFNKDTLISTPNGAINVNKLRIGDLVYTASGSIHKVVKLNKYRSLKNVIFTAAGVFPTRCTSDHKVFSKICTNTDGNISYSDPEFREISELNENDLIALPILKFDNNTINSNFEIPMAYLIGVYINHGYFLSDDLLFNAVILEIPNSTPLSVKNIISKYIKLLFNKFNSYKDGKSTIYRIHHMPNEDYKSNNNNNFIELCIKCGIDNKSRRFPSILFSSPIDVIKSLISGYEDSCKSIIVKDKTNVFTKVTTTSPYIANDYILLMRSIGKFPTCHFSKNENLYEIFYNTSRADEFELDDKYSVIWSPIYSIDYDTSYNVYCPTVMPVEDGTAEEHTIIANGIAVTQCGGVGSMIAIRPNGDIYPCLRYMPTSVGNNVKDLKMGSVKEGFIGREENSEVLNMMDKITRRSQTNDICFECPLSNTCASCSALSHTVYGTPNKRTYFSCIQSIAEHLANVYYWNRLLIKHPEYNLSVRKNVIPDEWSLLVIDKDELDDLKLIECMAMDTKIKYELGNN